MMNYFLLQLKRMLKLLPYVFAATVVLMGCLFAAFNFLGASSSQQESVRFDLGIVGSTEDSYLTAGLEIVQSYDASRFAVDFIQMDEDEAKQALEKGRIGAYVVIPEDYIRNAVSGKLGSLKYVSTTGAADLTALFKDEITAVVSDVIIACEQSMYGVEDTLALKDLEERSGKYISDISLTYVDYILDRHDMYNVQELGLHDSLGLDGYLFSGVCVLIFCLLLIPICSVSIKSDYAFERLVMSKNIGAVGQVAGEYGAIFVSYSILILLLSAVITLFSSTLPQELSRLFAVFSFKQVYVALAVVFSLSAIAYLLMQLVKNMVSGALLYFAASLALCFGSGCLYPLSFFPDSMERFAQLLPHYYCRTAFSALITGDSAGIQFVVLLTCGAAMLFIAMLVRSVRLRKGQV